MNRDTKPTLLSRKQRRGFMHRNCSMDRKPTYEELKQRCNELEKEVLELRQAEELLRDSEAKYRDLFDNAPIGMFQSTVEGKLLNVNKAYAQIFRHECPTDVIAFVTDTARQVDVQPGLWKRIVDIILKRDRFLNFENHYVREDGSVFIGNLHVRSVRNNDGSVRYLEGFVEDITERKHAKESLEQSNIAMLDMVESIGDGFFSLDDEFVVTYFNRAAEQLLGRKSWEILGHNYFKTFPEFKGSMFEDTFIAGINERVPLSFETYFHMKPYENWYEVRVYPQKNGISVYFQVTTQRKRAEEEKKRLAAQLQQAQKMKAISTLAGGIANDFNNLLSVIEGNASLMLFDIDAAHPHYEHLKSIEKQAQGGAKLSAQLLGYVGKGRYEVKRLDLNQVLEETAEAFGRTRKEITIHRELADDLFATEADQSQIKQVLSNLFVNAAEAMPGGGDLFLKTTNVTHRDMEGKLYDPKPGKYIMVTVADTGMGMDEKTMEHIFEPFFTTKEASRNAGLGLSSAYGIIEGHGGYIDVASEKGNGTTFSIYLQALRKRVQKIVTKEKKPPEAILKGTGTVLIVDDEQMILEIGEDMLCAMGYKVLSAAGGRESVEIYEANKDEIDLVILDMIMPDMAGGEAYDRMKEINPNVKVLLSTGYSVEGQARQILDRGCNGLIQKPFGVKELSAEIQKILDE